MTYTPGDGWTTQPAPYYYGEDEDHTIENTRYFPVGTIDHGSTHRRIIGLHTPEYIQEIATAIEVEASDD